MLIFKRVRRRNIRNYSTLQRTCFSVTLGENEKSSNYDNENCFKSPDSGAINYAQKSFLKLRTRPDGQLIILVKSKSLQNFYVSRHESVISKRFYSCPEFSNLHSYTFNDRLFYSHLSTFHEC